MTDKFQTYVKAIKNGDIFNLIIIPVIVVILLMFYANPFLYSVERSFYNYIGIFQDNKEHFFAFDNYSNIIHEIIKFLFALLVMTKISRISLNSLGITKEKCFFYYLKGTLLGIVEIFSVFFTAIHLGNPNITLLGGFNIFLAGVTFSLIYYYTGSLLLVGAMHTFWNFIIAFIVGSPVSGIVTFDSVFFSVPVENKDLISGGTFGFEASIVTTIVQIAISIFVIYLIRKEKVKEA